MRTRTMERPASMPATPKSVTSEIESPNALDLDMLRRLWRSLMGRAAPAHLSRNLLVHILAYRQQAQAHGDLDRATLRVLEAAMGQDSPTVAAHFLATGSDSRSDLRPGTLLMREHEGALHRVMVLDHGFAWNGKAFASLSKVAHAITGTRWNGPRFFGLRGKAKGTIGNQKAGHQKIAARGRPDPASSSGEATP